MRGRGALRRLAAGLAAALLLAGGGFRAGAAGAESSPPPDFSGRSWREIVEEFLGEYDVSRGDVAIGYYNTVTGEAHFYCPDQYMVAASMYKVPLAMAVTDKLAAEGRSAEDIVDGVPYGSLIKGMLVHSNNHYAEILWGTLGSYQDYRRTIAPYMGEDPETVDGKFYENNYFTARQMLRCLKTLYDGREGAYSRIVELMGQASPGKYFRLYEDRYPVAQKYGYVPDYERGGSWYNDCGIIGADDPYLLVCFTRGFKAQKDFMGRLCLLMSDYTQYRHQWLTLKPSVRRAICQAPV